MCNNFKEKISSLDNSNKILSMNYFNKFDSYTNLLNIVLSKKNIVRNSFGNYNAKIVYIVEFDNTNDPIIDLLKKYYSKNNRNFYSVYLTPLSKFENRELDMKILIKELEIIKPRKIISLGVDFPKASKTLSEDDLKEIKKYLEDKSNKNTIEFEKAKNNITDCINFAMNG